MKPYKFICIDVFSMYNKLLQESNIKKVKTSRITKASFWSHSKIDQKYQNINAIPCLWKKLVLNTALMVHKVNINKANLNF